MWGVFWNAKTAKTPWCVTWQDKEGVTCMSEKREGGKGQSIPLGAAVIGTNV